MSGTSFVTVMVMLGVVLVAMGVALRFLRRYTMGVAGSGSALKMEVVQRLTLGQRQGIAVVRIGSRFLAVSMGDGGVHPIAEVDESDLTVLAEATTPAATAAVSALTSTLGKLRALSLVRGNATEPAPARINYVAPMEDFEAVLSIAMGGSAR